MIAKPRTLLVLIAFFSLAAPLRADVVYQYTAVVYTISDSAHQLPSSIQIGSTVTGTFSYNSAAPGSSFYYGVPVNMMQTATVDGTYTFSSTTPTSSDQIDLLSGTPNTFGFYAYGPNTPVPSIPGVNVSLLDAFNISSSTTDLSTTVLTNQPGAEIGIGDPLSSPEPYYYIGSHITSLVAVPEPSPMLLGALGALALLGSYRWRHFRQRTVAPSCAAS